MSAAVPEIEFDGERFVPGAGVEITYHHWLRYVFAAPLAYGKRVLDVASGEGYGAAYLAQHAQRVDGFDTNEAAVSHARAAYGQPSLSFTCADIESFFARAAPASYDLVTAFEIIEHVDEQAQHKLLEGIRSVLAPGGVALVSTPDKQLYTDVRLTKNEFHVRELYREEFIALCNRFFPHVNIFEQLTYTGSVVFAQAADTARVAEMSWTDQLRLKGKPQQGLGGGGEYLVAVLSDQPSPKLESAILVDRSRKLISEEVAVARRDVERLRHLEAVVKDLERQNAELRAVWLPPEEAKRRYDLQQVIIDRLLGVIQANAREMQRNGHGERTELQERRRREELENMVSVRLVLRAKSVLDRTPGLKSFVKGVLKPFV